MIQLKDIEQYNLFKNYTISRVYMYD